MTAENIARAAQEAGFECSALDIHAARGALDIWRRYAADNPDIPDAEALEEEIADARCVLVLALPYRMYEGYPRGVGHVSAYYLASQQAYVAAKELAAVLAPVGARMTRRLPLKPLARAAGLGDYGRNGIIVRKGSHIALQGLLLACPPDGLPAAHEETADCAACGACERACPAGALRGGEVDTSRCLRTHMNGNPLPAEVGGMMGDLLLGCDACLNACPGKKRIPMPEEFENLFAFDVLLDAERYAAVRKAISRVIGTNYANTVRDMALRRQERRETT